MSQEMISSINSMETSKLEVTSMIAKGKFSFRIPIIFLLTRNLKFDLFRLVVDVIPLSLVTTINTTIFLFIILSPPLRGSSYYRSDILDFPLVPFVFHIARFFTFAHGHGFHSFLRELFIFKEILLRPLTTFGVFGNPPLLDQSLKNILQVDVIIGVVVVTNVEMIVFGFISPCIFSDRIMVPYFSLLDFCISILRKIFSL